MRRPIVTLVATVSLLLWVTVLVIWVRSFRTDEHFYFSYHSKAYRILIRSGATIVDNDPEIVAQTEREEKARRAIAAVPGSMFLLFVPRGERVVSPPSQIPLPWSKSSYVPLPAAAVLLLIAPFSVVVNWGAQRKRVKLGLCARCGYDLTANTSGVCPECGSKVAEAISAQ